MIQEPAAGMHAMRFEGLTDRMLIVWTDQPLGRRTIECAKESLVSITGVLGDAIKSKNRPGGRLHVEIDSAGGPLYFVWGAGDKGVRQ